MTTVVSRPIHFRGRDHGRRVASATPSPLAALPAAKIPRVARLMALAIRFDTMLRSGEAGSLSELARRHHISQPRVTQVLNLTLLAPDIVERLLFLPATAERATVTERELRAVVAVADWGRQASRLTSTRGT